MRTCVIYNPAAGRGRVTKLLDAIRRRAPAGAEFRPTAGPRDAERLAADAARDGFARVAAAGGDGTVHEVANGLLDSGVADVRLAVLPVGSMNDYAFTLGVSDWWAAGRGWDALAPMRVDVGVLRAGDRSRWFVNGCGVGFNGMVTVEARKIRYLTGVPLYATAVFAALVRHFAVPVLNVTSDGMNEAKPTVALSFAIGQREGGFPLTPFARLDDGRFDILRVGNIRRWELIRHFPGMMTGNLPTDHPEVSFGQCATADIRAGTPLCVHADGELICVPADDVRSVGVEIREKSLVVEADPIATYGLRDGKSRFERVRIRPASRLSR